MSALEARALDYYERANSLLDDGKSTDAIRLYRQAGELFPDRSSVWHNLGLAYEHEPVSYTHLTLPTKA